MTTFFRQSNSLIAPQKQQQRLVNFVLFLLCISLTLMALANGELQLSLSEVWRACFHQGPPFHSVVVLEWRLPRIVMALLLGAGLAISGAVFQSLIRNPLGSPDVIGFNTGAFTGVIFTVILFGSEFWQTALGALVGGFTSAALVYFLAYRNGAQGFRLIIVGIGIGAMLNAFNMWLLISASLEDSYEAALWVAGSLNGITWAKGLPASVVLIVFMFCTALLVKRMQLLEMGDDAAAALGVNVEQTRLLLMLSGVALTAAATAAAGPISFIALAAPQIVKRISGTHTVSLFSAGLMGASLLALADYIALTLVAPNQLPVGIVTVCLGGIYLIWLIIQESKTK